MTLKVYKLLIYNIMTTLNITPKQEKIIKQCIVENPFNLQLAFRKASQVIELYSARQIQHYWYRYLRYDECLITLSTSKFKGYNTKNFVTETKSIKLKHTDTFSIQYVIPFGMK